MAETAPCTWEEWPFGELVTRLVNGGTPPTEVAVYWQGHTPWITGADFTPSGLSGFRRFVSEGAVRQTATNVIAKGELLLVTRTGVGKLAIAPCDVAISQDITGVYPNREKVTVEYLYYRMRQGVEELKKLNQGTSINGIIRDDLVKYRIALPPVSQQKRIAEILSTVDEAIEQTEELIAKTQHIKAGLMNDLFGRGVNANGQLRPPREVAPQLYKESPLGWIPREWGAAKFAELLCSGAIAEIQDGNHGELHPKREDFVPEGIPFLMARDIAGGLIDLDGCYRITAEQYRSLRIGFSIPGDVLLSHKGTIGETAIVPDNLPSAMLTPQVTYYRVKPDGPLQRYFLLAWMRSPAFQSRMKSLAAQSTRDYVGITAQKSLLGAVIPSRTEQKQIVSIVEAIERKLGAERVSLRNFTQLKSGLMQDLLTGRVQVCCSPRIDDERTTASV